jgi:uncharacterized protein (DUF1810 family)
MSTEDPLNLQRFVDAQAGVYAAARAGVLEQYVEHGG